MCRVSPAVLVLLVFGAWSGCSRPAPVASKPTPEQIAVERAREAAEKQMAEATSKSGELLSTKEGDDVVQLETPVMAEEEKRVLRKIDCTLLPMMCIVFFFQYIDKQGLSYGSVSWPFNTNGETCPG